MKKTTKGAFAAGGAAAILLGGAGTLAYWTDSVTANGGTLSSGSISLGSVTCAGWKHVEDDASVVKIVPGDQVYNDCDTSLTLVGDHIGATLAIDPASIPTTTALGADLSAAVTLEDSTGTPIAAVTSAGTTSLTAHIVVTFPYGDATTISTNDSQSGTATLDALDLTAVQTHEATPTAP